MKNIQNYTPIGKPQRIIKQSNYYKIIIPAFWVDAKITDLDIEGIQWMVNDEGDLTLQIVPIKSKKITESKPDETFTLNNQEQQQQFNPGKSNE